MDLPDHAQAPQDEAGVALSRPSAGQLRAWKNTAQDLVEDALIVNTETGVQAKRVLILIKEIEAVTQKW